MLAPFADARPDALDGTCSGTATVGGSVGRARPTGRLTGLDHACFGLGIVAMDLPARGPIGLDC